MIQYVITFISGYQGRVESYDPSTVIPPDIFLRVVRAQSLPLIYAAPQSMHNQSIPIFCPATSNKPQKLMPPHLCYL
jgi:hypothetical protein